MLCPSDLDRPLPAEILEFCPPPGRSLCGDPYERFHPFFFKDSNSVFPMHVWLPESATVETLVRAANAGGSVVGGAAVEDGPPLSLQQPLSEFKPLTLFNLLDGPPLRPVPSLRRVDVAFVIDATGSMEESILAVRDYVGSMAVILRLCDRDARMRFACVCYRNPIDTPTDKHDRFDFTPNPVGLKQWLSGIHAYGGGPEAAEDYVGAVEELNQLTWAAQSQKAVFWIADREAPGKIYGGGKKHWREPFLKPLICGLAERRIRFFGFALMWYAEQTFLKFAEFYKEINPKLTFEVVSRFNPVKAGELLRELDSATIGASLKTSVLGFGTELIRELLR
jgi:hypothetical protein